MLCLIFTITFILCYEPIIHPPFILQCTHHDMDRIHNYKSMAAIPSLYERNQEATVYCGNLDQKVNENVLWELFTQCGPVVNVHIPRDKITN